MAITDLSSLINASKTGQFLSLAKNGARTTIANLPFSAFDLAGNPGAGTLAAGNTVNVIVPTDAGAGYPTIRNFTPSNNGYIGLARVNNSVTCNIALYDRLFVCGAYAFNANTNLASQPSFASRVPSTDYTGLELWVETVTAATGNQAWSVGYTNENGTAGRVTGAQGIGAAPTVGRCWRLNLQTGDQGIQRIDNVTGSVGTAGTANIMILRKLFETTISVANAIVTLRFDDLLLPQIYENSALYPIITPVSTAIGTPNVGVIIVQG